MYPAAGKLIAEGTFRLVGSTIVIKKIDSPKEGLINPRAEIECKTMWLDVIKNTAKAVIPFKNALRKIYRLVRPYHTIKSNDEFAFQQGLEIIQKALRHSPTLHRVLEIGTGWHPTIPMMFKAVGVKHLILTDIEPLMDDHTLDNAKSFVRDRLPHLSKICGISRCDLERNLNNSIGISYIYHFDSKRLTYKDIDVIYSRTVLEHIEPNLLENMHQDLADNLSKNGVFIHFVDNSDHYEHGDKSLSRLNFLKFNPVLWSLACINPQAYQNRLRHSDYKALFKRIKLRPLFEAREICTKSLNELKTMSLHDDFQHYSPDDLATITSKFVLRPE